MKIEIDLAKIKIKHLKEDCSGLLAFKFEESSEIFIEDWGLVRVKSPMYVFCSVCNEKQIPEVFLNKVKQEIISSIFVKEEVVLKELIFFVKNKLPKLQIIHNKDYNKKISKSVWEDIKKRCHFIYWGNRNQPLYLR